MNNAPISQTIKNTIDAHDIVLFMKGNAKFPQCGFSALVVQILQNSAPGFHDVNVLLDPDLRQGIKEYSDWPTIPQLYVKGEFIGGCDIVKEMFESGELSELLSEKGIAANG